MLILAFDTSGPWVAAALLRDDLLLAARVETMERGQAESLMPLVTALLGEAGGIGFSEIDLIACGTGPGNFTGTRIAVAAARGLALALKRPAIGVTLLEAAAYGKPRPTLIALDARRGESYVQRFGEGAMGPELTPAGSALPVAGAASILGDAEALKDLPSRQDLPPAERLVEAMARIAQGRAAGQHPRPAPLYLRAADAAPPREPPPVILP